MDDSAEELILSKAVERHFAPLPVLNQQLVRANFLTSLKNQDDEILVDIEKDWNEQCQMIPMLKEHKEATAQLKVCFRPDSQHTMRCLEWQRNNAKSECWNVRAIIE